MSYRPITDVWVLARAKLKNGMKYYGAFLGGFVERARALLGVTINDPVLQVRLCSLELLCKELQRELLLCGLLQERIPQPKTPERRPFIGRRRSA